jgi:hypothetical protein
VQRKEKFLLLSWLCVCSVSCKQDVGYKGPQVERCISNGDTSAECADLRLPDGEQVYTRYDMSNYVCTSPADENTMFQYVTELRKRIIELENNRGN